MPNTEPGLDVFALFYMLNLRYGVLPESLQPSKESPAVDGEDKVMQEVTR